jgi:hypothetical protein
VGGVAKSDDGQCVGSGTRGSLVSWEPVFLCSYRDKLALEEKRKKKEAAAAAKK